MNRNLQRLLALTAVTGLLLNAAPASAAFDKPELGCRKQVAKNARNYTKTVLKTLRSCHKSSAKKGGGLDCNSIAVADADRHKIARAGVKFRSVIGGEKDRCADVFSPASVLYNDCPAGDSGLCEATISDFSGVADCLICLIEGSTQAYAATVLGSPPSPIPGVDDAKCNDTVIKDTSKYLLAIMKDVASCQGKLERGGVTSVDDCVGIDYPSSKVSGARDKAVAKVANTCGRADLNNLDVCLTAQLDLCATDDAAARGLAVVTQSLQLGSGGPPTTTTTTTISTTTTTLAPTDGDCPDFAIAVLHGGISDTICTSNADCTTPPGTCDLTLDPTPAQGLCRRVTSLATGFTGSGHGADINDKVDTAVNLNCPGPGPVCGQCTIAGVSPDFGNCRCSNDTRVICDEPFASDSDHCGGNVCDCYLGAPLPLAAGGVAACAVNRIAQDITGTANVDTGANLANASLRTTVYLGVRTTTPCPYCGGSCADEPGTPCATDVQCSSLCDPGLTVCEGGPFANQLCANNADCDAGACTGTDDIPNDGIRNGTCVEGANDGLPCDAMSPSYSYPAPGGGQYSLDCIPEVGKNVSPGGLVIDLEQTTGTAPPLVAQVECDTSQTTDCHCRSCAGDIGVPCRDDATCADAGLGRCAVGSCSGNPAQACPGGGECFQSGTGTCINAACTLDSQCTATVDDRCLLCAGGGDSKPNGCDGACTVDEESCNFDSDCQHTCDTGGSGTCVSGPFMGAGCASDAQCSAGVCEKFSCTDTGATGINAGVCTSGPDDGFCDGVLLASGDPLFSCVNNTECTNKGPTTGLCTIEKRRPCFLPTITAEGQADPVYPVGVALFCVPKTGADAINSAAGLPGPGRIVNQLEGKSFCASDRGVQYVPGVGGCPPAAP